jgi:TorA maturation chaperone TorD
MVLLITEDFMVKEKKATVILLSWLREGIKTRQKRRILLRPHVVSWLTEQLEKSPEDADADLYVNHLP